VKAATVSSDSRAAAAAPATAPTNPDTTAFRFDPATLQRISRELALDIGPIADVVVKRAASGCSSTADLCRKVAEEIESPQQRAKFLGRVSASDLSGPVMAKVVQMPKAARIESVVKAVVISEPSKPVPAPNTAGLKSSSWILIVTAASLLVAGAVVGRRILATGRSGSSATATDSRQPDGEVQLSAEKTRVPETQAPAQNLDGTTSNPANPADTGLKRVDLSPDIAQGLLSSKVMPTYPNLARQAHVQGMVVLEVDISKEGAIESLRTVSGHPMLIPAAIDAVKQWRYKPYLINGSPVPVQTQVTVNFNLSNA
jgi:TonB family protein